MHTKSPMFFYRFIKITCCCLAIFFASQPVSAQLEKITSDVEKDKPKKFQSKTLKSEKTGDKKFTLPRRIVQNTASHYNYYFNANNKLNEVIERARLVNRDNYSKLLPFYSYNLNSTAAQASELDSVIYKATAGILLHDLRTEWVDNFYLLIGRAYLLRKDFDSASMTFQFINYNLSPRKKDEDDQQIVGSNINGGSTVSIANKEKTNLLKKAFTKQPSRNEAFIWQIRSLTETGEYGDAAGLINTLQNDPNFPQRLTAALEEVNAYWFYKQGYYDSAAYHLEKALPNAADQQERARSEYLLAQLYERTRNRDKASQYYSRAIKHTTDPLLDIYANLSTAKMYNTEEPNELDFSIATLIKMAKRDKFEPYRDIVYYSAGEIALQKPDTNAAELFYNKSLHYNKTNSEYKNKSFLKLAEINFNRKKYKASFANYDSLEIGDTSLGDLAQIQSRRNSLEKIVEQMNIIERQDSLQVLALMPETERIAFVKKLSKRLRKERGLKDDENYNAINPSFAFDNAKDLPELFSSNTQGDWYFYNASIKSKGYSEFRSRWGKRDNVDNWRRITATGADNNYNNNIVDNNNNTSPLNNDINNNGLNNNGLNSNGINSGVNNNGVNTNGTNTDITNNSANNGFNNGVNNNGFQANGNNGIANNNSSNNGFNNNGSNNGVNNNALNNNGSNINGNSTLSNNGFNNSLNNNGSNNNTSNNNATNNSVNNNGFNNNGTNNGINNNGFNNNGTTNNGLNNNGVNNSQNNNGFNNNGINNNSNLNNKGFNNNQPNNNGTSLLANENSTIGGMTGDVDAVQIVQNAVEQENKNPKKNVVLEDISFDAMMANIPVGEERMKASNALISNALYRLAQLFQNSLEDYSSAVETYEKSLQRFPDSLYGGELYMNLSYCYQKLGNTAKANYYKNLLTTKFKESTYAGNLLNPKAAIKTNKDPQATKRYENIYNLFIEGQFEKALQEKKAADSLYGNNYWSPQLLYIEAVFYVRQRNDSLAISTLSTIINNYPNSALKAKAANMIDVLSRRNDIESYLSNLQIERASENAPTVITESPATRKPPPAVRNDTAKSKLPVKPPQPEKKDTVATTKVQPPILNGTYSFVPEASQFVVMLLDKVDPVYISEAKNAFNRFNREKFSGKAIEIKKDILDKDKNILLFSAFENADAAMAYSDVLKKNVSSELSWLPASKYSFFIISDANLQLLKSKKDLQTYLKLLSSKYPGKF